MVPSKVCQLLEKVGCDDVYEFLACERSAPLEELREAADAKYRQIHNQSSSTDAQKAARDLAGLCKAAIFMDAASKRAYDEETDTRRKPEGGVVSAVVAAVVVVAVVVGAAWMVWQGAVWVVDRVEGWVSRPVEEGPVEPPAPLPHDPPDPEPEAEPEDGPQAEERRLGLDRAARTRVQVALSEGDYDPGEADGLLGERSRNALRAWQRDRDLEVTGYLTRETAERLGAFDLDPDIGTAEIDAGTLTIRGDPLSSISVDGAFVGSVPEESGVVVVREVEPGSHFVVARREGYRTVERVVDVVHGRAEVVDATRGGMSGLLAVSADVAGALLRINDGEERALPVTDLEIAPGSHDLAVSREGYRPVKDRIDVRPGQLVSRNVILEAIPHEERVMDALDPALAHFRAGDYRAVVDAVRSVLDVVGNSVLAYWLLGVGLYELGEFVESVQPLTMAIGLGAEVVLPAKHRHGGGGFREGFCIGTLTLSLDEIAFVSVDDPGHGFAVAPDKMTEPTVAQSVGGFPYRLNTGVRDLERGIERNNFDFVHWKAEPQAADPDSLRLVVLGCPDCDASMFVQHALMTTVIRGASQ